MEQNNHELYHYGVKGMKWGVIRKRIVDRVNAHKKARDIDKEAKAKIREMQAKRRNDEIVKKAKANAAARVAAAKKDLDNKYPSAKQIEEAKKAAAAKRAEDAKKVEENPDVDTEPFYKTDGMTWNKRRILEKVEKEKRKQAAAKPKTIADMSDDELRQAINRMQLVNQYKNLMPEQKSKGKEAVSKYAGKLMDQVIVPVATDAGKKWLTKTVNKTLGLEVKADDYETLKKTYDTLKVKKDIQDMRKNLSKATNKELSELKDKHEKAKLERELSENKKKRLEFEKDSYYIGEDLKKIEEEKKKKKENN